MFPATEESSRWAKAARSAAQALLSNPTAMAGQDLRHGKTWMVGLDALANKPDGTCGNVPLVGPWRALTPKLPLHPAQLSVVFPQYPRQDPDQSDANHRFRYNRSAAHVDGLLPEGPEKRRYVREFHAYVLGIALNICGGSPTVYWKGSHHIMRAALTRALSGPQGLDADVTEVYQDARKLVFETCEKVLLKVAFGESFLLHRFALHGTDPWHSNETNPRITAFFRPEFATAETWLHAP